MVGKVVSKGGTLPSTTEFFMVKVDEVSKAPIDPKWRLRIGPDGKFELSEIEEDLYLAFAGAAHDQSAWFATNEWAASPTLVHLREHDLDNVVLHLQQGNTVELLPGVDLPNGMFAELEDSRDLCIWADEVQPGKASRLKLVSGKYLLSVRHLETSALIVRKEFDVVTGAASRVCF